MEDEKPANVKKGRSIKRSKIGRLSMQAIARCTIGDRSEAWNMGCSL
jgi:hypothetical protein